MRIVLLGLCLLSVPAQSQALIRSIDYPSPTADANFGAAVAAVPDINGDAVGDLIVGAPRATSAILSRLGRAYTFSGATGVPLDTLISPNTETEGAFGYSVAGLPDRNGDGRGDVLVGAYQESVAGSERAGRAYVLAGITETVLSSHVSPNTLAYSRFGETVRAVPDVSGDGIPDYAVAATYEFNARGRVYLYSGADGSLLRTVSNPGSDGWTMGQAMAGVPDVDGDGRGDLLLVAPANGGLGFGSGRVYLFSGATGTLLLTLSPPPSTSFESVRVASLPDIDGDGRADLVVTRFSEARLYSSVTGALLRSIPTPTSASSVEGIADLNGDGAGDLVVGMRSVAQGPDPNVGAVVVYSGASGAVLLTLASPNPRAQGYFGQAVAVLPDVTGDGRPDLLIGAPGESVAGFAGAGRVYLFSTSGIVAWEVAPEEATLDLRVSPNPARGAATVRFTLGQPARVRLTLHDALGRTVAVVADEARAAGAHTAALDGSRLAPGLYLARLATPDGVATARLVVGR